jgi:hypothetical protein
MPGFRLPDAPARNYDCEVASALGAHPHADDTPTQGENMPSQVHGWNHVHVIPSDGGGADCCKA